MNGVSCVKGEIHNVLAVLRITGRSSSSFFDFGVSSSSYGRGENIEILRHKLIASFKELHLFLGLQNGIDLHEIDTTVFIRPFCDVILSDGIRGIDVMNVTLTSIHKFLLYGLISNKSLKVFEALNSILIESIFNMKFDDNSRCDKELIHIRLQEILLELLRCSAGYLLTNDNVCLCVQKCFEMRQYHRNYHKTNNCLMVRYTENVLIQMILLIFNKIKTNQCITSSIDNSGFNIRAMARILKYLTVIINPNQIDTSQDIREFGLRLINVALETAGTELNNHPSLIKIIQDDLCRQLLINSQSHNFLILSLTLRVIFDLFNAVKQQIRVQLEVFFISIHLRIAESASSSFEQKELILESIVEFCREPDLIIGLYTNYDCQVGSTHLFEDLCNFLLNKATIDKTQNRINNLHLIAAEGILAIIDCIARKFIDNKEHNQNQQNIKEEYDQITKEQKRKRKLKLAARCFNNKLSKSFGYLQEMGTLQNPLAASDVAQFLFANPYLDKVKIGEFLGKGKDFNNEALDSYVNLFDFSNMSPDEAMRFFLESFVLRGEAQAIDRILEQWSKKVFNDRNKETSPLKSHDAMHILAFSMIQLNTDAHNDQIKNKMTLESYIRNLKGQNVSEGQKDGESFPDAFLSKIYYSITSNEIKVRSGNFKDIFYDNQNNNNFIAYQSYDSDDALDEKEKGHPDDSGSDHSLSSSKSAFYLDAYSSSSTYNVKDVKKSEWIQILKKSQKLHKFSTIAPPTNGAEMFNILWEPALRILQFHLRYAGHPKVLDRVVQGIQTLARIAHCYHIPAAFNAIMHSICNHLMMCLLQFGTENELLPTTFDSRIYKTASQQEQERMSNSLSSMKSHDMEDSHYSSISVPYFLSAASTMDREDGDAEDTQNTLAMDIRITFTVKVFFDLVQDYGGLLLVDGWSSVMKVLLCLFHLDLIPHSEFEMEDFTDSEGIPLPSLSDPVHEERNVDDDSTVNAFTSWISSAFGSIFTAPPGHELEAGNVPTNPLKEEPHAVNAMAVTHDSEERELEPFIEPKCQKIIDSVVGCAVGDIFSSSKTYHVKSFVHLVRTLISLSNTYCNTTIAASSFIEEQTPSVTTHTITSLDPAPIQTSQLMETITAENQKNSGYTASDKETNMNKKHSASKEEDVICLPLTIDMKIFCLERLSQVLSFNINRIHEVWTPVTDHFQSLVLAQKNSDKKQKTQESGYNKNSDVIRHSNYFFERIAVNILKLCVELTESDESNLVDAVSIFLNLFLSLDDSILFVVGRRIIAGIKLLLNIQLTLQQNDDRREERQCFKEEKDWKIILFLMKRFANNVYDKQCCLDAFHLTESISKYHLKIANFNYVLNVLTTFGKHELEAPIHNTRVIEIILSIHSRLLLISDDNESVLAQMWHKTLSNIASFCTNKDYVTRRFAINSLHKALLQYPIKIKNKNCFVEPTKLLFQTVLLPLLLQVTKLENDRVNNHTQNRNHKPPNEEELNEITDDLRLKLLTLIFQVFLHDINMLIQYDTDNNFDTLWYKFLSTMRKFTLMAQNDTNNKRNLITHSQESIKNVILVFQSNRVFETLSDRTNTNVWDKSWQIIDQIAPGLKEELQIKEEENTDNRE